MTPKQIGLAIIRIQPFHIGHARIIDRMIKECNTVIIGIGSTQDGKSLQNPWPFEIRKQFLQNVYGDRLKILPLVDLGSDNTTTDWCTYVLEKINKIGLPTPTDYYTGSVADSVWYTKMFGDRLHIIDRTELLISATEIRTLIQFNGDWKKYVPRVNWDLVENTFPEEYKGRI